MTFKTSNAAAIAALSAMVALVDAGGGPGQLVIFGGDEANPVTLAELTMSQPAFPAATDNGEKAATTSANPITGDDSANADGTATFYQIKDAAGNVVFSGDVGAADSQASLKLDNVDLKLGGKVGVSSLVITTPQE